MQCLGDWLLIAINRLLMFERAIRTSQARIKETLMEGTLGPRRGATMLGQVVAILVVPGRFGASKSTARETVSLSCGNRVMRCVVSCRVGSSSMFMCDGGVLTYTCRDCACVGWIQEHSTCHLAPGGSSCQG